MTPQQPLTPRAIVFIDGQNLFYAAKEAFGYTYPNYNPLCLSQALCGLHGWNLVETRFYTGIPDIQDDPFWHQFWTAKLAHLGKVGVTIFSRPLRYRNQTVKLPDGTMHTFLVGQEKGVDVRIALDIVRLASENVYDVCIILSQDQDLTEAVEEVKIIGKKENRWMKLACAYPKSPTSRNKRGIDKTDWIHITRPMYDACIDMRDYRPKEVKKP